VVGAQVERTITAFIVLWAETGRGAVKVTGLKIQARNKTRVNVFLDGEYALSLSKIVAARLAIGQVLDEDRLEALRQADAEEQAYERALKFLAPRPRSQVEVRRRLQQHKVPDGLIDAVLQRLRQAGLVDDTVFAGYWVENRQTFRPRSRRALQWELRRKGLDSEAVQAALAGADDAQAAETLAAQRARRLANLPEVEFRRKLQDFLLRRGFDYDTIKATVDRAWQASQATDGGA